MLNLICTRNRYHTPEAYQLLFIAKAAHPSYRPFPGPAPLNPRFTNKSSRRDPDTDKIKTLPAPTKYFEKQTEPVDLAPPLFDV